MRKKIFAALVVAVAFARYNRVQVQNENQINGAYSLTGNMS